MVPESMVPESMIRIKLPKRCSYAAGPSGEADYQIANDNALAEARPDGFEYIYPRADTQWPVDSEGCTWARLRYSDETAALTYWMSRAHQLEKQLDDVKEWLSKLPIKV